MLAWQEINNLFCNIKKEGREENKDGANILVQHRARRVVGEKFQF